MPTPPWYIRYATRHKPDQVITANNEGSSYMSRWCLIPKNRFFNIYLHRFTGPDQRVMHDHPWISLGYVLYGRLYEAFAKNATDEVRYRWINSGKWTYRNSKFLHYLHLSRNTPCVWTIFITGPKIKSWGFLTKDGWRPWKKVIANFNENERRDY